MLEMRENNFVIEQDGIKSAVSVERVNTVVQRHEKTADATDEFADENDRPGAKMLPAGRQKDEEENRV